MVRYLFVSLAGCDEWSGTLPAPNQEGMDGPFATLKRAQAEIRKLNKDCGDIHVQIREGTYYLNETLNFGPEDSGTYQCQIIYEAYKGEQPVISGGERITGWQEIMHRGKRTWIVQSPDQYFHNLWVNQKRRWRPVYPRNGQLLNLKKPNRESKHEGSKRFVVGSEHIKLWKNLSDVELTLLTEWVESRMPIEKVDPERGIIFTSCRSAMCASENPLQNKYFLDNVFEELDSQGQWYYDREGKKLYYIPYDHESVETTEIIRPHLIHAIKASGNPLKPIEYITFKGLTFAHTEWWRTPETKIFRWNIKILEPVEVRNIINEEIADDKCADSQAAVSCESAVKFEFARFCIVEHCTVRNTGTYGIHFGLGCTGNRCSSCLIFDTGGGGIKLGTVQPKEGDITGHNIIEDCHIHHCGAVFYSAVGIWIGNSGNNTVRHCLVHDINYSGISIGWTWGYNASSSYNNLVEYNEVYNIALDGKLHDLAAIYTVGRSCGTIIRNNLLHHVGHDIGAGGFYADEGSSFIRFEKNIVHHIIGNAFPQNFGTENIIKNNIFVKFSRAAVLRGNDEKCTASFTFENNIVCMRQADVLAGACSNGYYRFDRNLYWMPCNVEAEFSGYNFDEWRKMGFDVHSIMVDPGFVDFDNDCYTLKNDSPAFYLEIEQIDTSNIGPRVTPGA